MYRQLDKLGTRTITYDNSSSIVIFKKILVDWLSCLQGGWVGGGLSSACIALECVCASLSRASLSSASLSSASLSSASLSSASLSSAYLSVHMIFNCYLQQYQVSRFVKILLICQDFSTNFRILMCISRFVKILFSFL